MHGASLAEGGYVAWRSEAVRQVVKALAAKGKQKGKLPLRVLRLPAIGGTDPETLASALSLCPDLRHLQLDYCYGDETIHPASYLAGGTDLTAALGGMQHLTHLKLTLSMSEYICGAAQQDLGRLVARTPDPRAAYIPSLWCLASTNHFQPDPFPPDQKVHVDGFFRCLPPSLQNLELSIQQQCQNPEDAKQPKQKVPPREFYVRTASLQHLVCLQALKLPEHLHIQQRDTWYTVLPSLVSLEYPWALVTQGAALLPLVPSLAVLKAGRAHPACLAALAGMSALRTLLCRPMLEGDGMDAAKAMVQLRQLQHLCAEVEVEGKGGCGVMPAAAAHWGMALSSLTSLHSLVKLQVELLELVDFSALPALHTVSINVNRTLCSWYNTSSTMERLLQQLAPSRGRLRQVVFHQAPPVEHPALSAMVAAAVGPVAVRFMP